MLSWLGFLVVPDARNDDGFFVASVETLASGRLGNVYGSDVVFFHPIIYMLIHKVESVHVGFSDKSLHFILLGGYRFVVLTAVLLA